MLMEAKGTGTIEYLPELRRIPIPRTPVNKGKRKDQQPPETPANLESKDREPGA
jgi:hypothetical protein